MEMADYYVTLFDKTWVECPHLPFTENDTRVCEMLMHAADLHLRMAEAKAATRVDARPQRPVPSSAGYKSQLEMMGH